jgi:hypothetical protein
MRPRSRSGVIAWKRLIAVTLKTTMPKLATMPAATNSGIA